LQPCGLRGGRKTLLGYGVVRAEERKREDPTYGKEGRSTDEGGPRKRNHKSKYLSLSLTERGDTGQRSNTNRKRHPGRKRSFGVH